MRQVQEARVLGGSSATELLQPRRGQYVPTRLVERPQRIDRLQVLVQVLMQVSGVLLRLCACLRYTTLTGRGRVALRDTWLCLLTAAM